ncbi:MULTISPECIES: Hsp20/alpha crystallin family protein [unclassified Solwaraspora]|uniref:Hsp20/alpha crystallin family protein n=1 Tax=unclassified Solwaraspora TaxID=2627926 RepID=UPI00259B4501|nr:Hsp20/alpha crystallin family protein [Solwaraspora sp. WMMA2056]WJK42053.1 Hsp20/alpha crystallin family protein [Solwaraspora sp. WMMA2056]
MSQPRDQMQDRGWDPIGNLQSLWSELNRALGGDAGPPEMELQDTHDGWRVVARLAGVAPEEVAVEVDGADLCVRARSEQEVNIDNGMPDTGSTERGFEYRLRLPSGVDVRRMDAVMDHGLLTVTMPRAEPGGRRSITVGRPQYQQPTAGSAAARASGGAKQVRIATDADAIGAAEADAIAADEVDPAADREMHHPHVGEASMQRQQASTAR